MSSAGAITGPACSSNFTVILGPSVQHVQALSNTFQAKWTNKLFISLLTLIVLYILSNTMSVDYIFPLNGRGDIIPCYHSSVGLNYCCVFSCYNFCSPGYVGQLQVVCLLSKPHLFTSLWKRSFVYTKNELAIICCSCKSQTDLS